MKRIHLIISGDVQGTGFRSFIKREAIKLDVTGWVKNREDGIVEVEAEGDEEKLKELVDVCWKGPDVAWVENVHVEWSNFQSEFLDFEIQTD